MKKLKRILKWLCISLGIIVALIISAGFIIAYFYGDEVKDRVISELNNYINTEIEVSDVNFSVFKKFPNAVIELKDVVAKSTDDFEKNDFKGNCDTLFTSRSLFLKFNIFDIIRKNYKLKFIDVYDGNLNIYIDIDGNDNYHFWKESDEESGDFELQLQKILFNEVKLNFISKPKALELETYTSKLDFSGDFNAGNYDLSTDGEFQVYKFMFEGVNYFNRKKVKLDLDLDVENDNYLINSGNLKVEDLFFSISGNLNVENKNNINLKIKGKNLDVRSFISLLPSKYKEEINDFSSSGQFYFSSSIVGVIDNFSTPHIEIDFGVQKGEIQRKGSDIKLTNVNVKGNYSNGDKNTIISSSLDLSEFDIRMGNSNIQGSYKMQNFKKPKVELIAKAEIELKELKEFFEFDTIENLSGLFETNFKFNGALNNMGKLTVKDFRKAQTEGDIKIKDGELKIENSSFAFSEINGGFKFKNNDIKIDSLALIANENDFYLKGYFKNILSYILIEDQNLNIDGTIKSKSIDVEKLFTIDENDDSGYDFPENIQINANVEIEHFKFDRFIAENVLGKIIYTNRSLTASPLNFNTMSGSLKTTGTIYQNDDNTFTTKCVTSLKDIDINKLFYTFKNFGQDFIKQEHLVGSLVSDIEYSSNWTNNFDIKEESIITSGNIKISNGELIKFEPLEALSKYISLDELKHIKFSTLENDILIKNRKITIPEMEIKSTATNIELSGEHTFDNEIKYRIKLLLSDVLFKKAKKNKKENEEFGVIEDDGLGRTSIYLSITGTTDDYKVTYDTKQVKEHIKESLQEEKQNLKQILNEEFGWFKNDSTIIHNKIDKDTTKTKFNIVWDEEEDEEEIIEEEDDW